MTYAEFDAEIKRLHEIGDRQGVVDLMRMYGLFTDEIAVEEYLKGGEL